MISEDEKRNPFVDNPEYVFFKGGGVTIPFEVEIKEGGGMFVDGS